MYISGPSGPPLSESYDTYVAPSAWDKDGSAKTQKRLDDELLSWLKSAVEEGTSFIRGCRAYEDIDKAIDLISLKVSDTIGKTGFPNTISNITINEIKRDVKEMGAILSNIRPSWVYEANSAKDPTWMNQSAIQNGLSQAWYSSTFFDRTLKKLLQWSIVEGTAYLSPIWNPHLFGLRKGGIETRIYRYNEVFPVQMGNDFDLQKAYAIVIKEELPINRVRKTYPHKAHLITPDRGMPSTSRGILGTAAKTFMDAISSADSARRNYPSPMVDVFYAYIDDSSINRTNHPVPMGEASWGYEVPYIGQQIKAGYNMDGSLRTTRATYEDCYLYPNRRLIIATNSLILYEGPSFWWHGKVPLVKYSPDDWVWSYLGYSMAAEIASMQRSSTQMRRAVEDALYLKIDPPMVVDDMAMSKTQAESKSIRVPGRRIRGKLQMGDFMKPVVSPQYYAVGQDHFEYIKEVEEKMKEILGLPDLKALQKARQVPSSDSIEKFFAEAGALVTDMSRSMDKPIWEIADMNRYYFFQFYDMEMRIKILGMDGLTEEDVDYEPGTLIPKSMPGEREDDNGLYLSSRLERAKHHISNFNTKITPTSLHQITHMQRKLLYMQATKLNPFLVDPETLAHQLDIANWGHLDGDTVMEKVVSFMKVQQGLALEQQILESQVQMAIQQQAQQAQQADQLGQILNQVTEAAGDVKAGGPNSGGAGRPPSFNQAPRLVQKGSGESGRTTITTS